ncbi:response regulator [Streptomyces sp. NPDC055059]|uniref:response regulator n=1 Tax=unclassified Streptomyces TaxID=2593676 RepID=UPI00225B4AA4|nr:response regulator [Streptomyces sp. NBC_00120]MCX5323165.1 response regulator [Streptomyces sp. NBC_00120]
MTAPQGAAADASSILIVDDMEENLVALEAVLGSLARVVRARSGEAALKAMLRQEFAVALIDVLMPGMNGFETAANIKGLDQTKDIPIILLTGAAVDPNYAYRGYTVGAADFLVKPFDPWLLRTKVNVFLELHRKNRQLADQAEQLTRLLAVDVPAEPPEEQHRLADVERQLAQVQRLLREREGTDGPDAAGLADRIAVLERAVGRLLEGQEQ